MRYTLNIYHFKVPDKELLADLRRTAHRLGKRTISAGDYDIEGNYNSKTIRSRFGLWNSALVRAGLRVQKLRRVTRRDLLDNIKRLWDLLRRQPLVKDLRRPRSAHSYNSYAKHFGSWRAALEAFVKLQQRKGSRYGPLTNTSAARPKAKRKRTIPRTINKSMRYDILKRDDYRCRLCGASPAIKHGVTLHIDHIIPLSAGGRSIPENLQTLCSDCNYGKGAKKQ